MANLIVHGGAPLSGRIVPSANKNAVLPILCATLLTKEPVKLIGIPEITDVRKLVDIFKMLGSDVSVDYASGVLEVQHRDTHFDPKTHHLPEEMRSSIMLVPPLLARFGVARIENDVQGCTLGVREIDPHVEVMERFGCSVERSREALIIRAEDGLKSNHHWLDYASVTTTENFVLCAALAHGTSTLMNAASEPHVQEFCAFMTLLGAQIEGIGTSRLTVHGVAALGGGSFSFAEDFHEAVTFLALGAITGGSIQVKNSAPEQFPLIDRTFAKFGVQVVHEGGWSHTVVDGPLRVKQPFTPNILQKIEAAPLALSAGGPAADLRGAGGARRRQRDVLEQGLRRRDGLDQRTVEVRCHGLYGRPAPHRHIRRQKAVAGRSREPVHHSRGDCALDAGGQHRRQVDHPKRHPHPPRPPALRRKHPRAGGADRMGRGRLIQAA